MRLQCISMPISLNCQKTKHRNSGRDVSTEQGIRDECALQTADVEACKSLTIDQILPQFSDPPKCYWIWWWLPAVVPGIPAAHLYRKVIHSALLLKNNPLINTNKMFWKERNAHNYLNSNFNPLSTQIRINSRMPSKSRWPGRTHTSAD